MTPIAPSLQQPVDAFLRYLKVERQLSPLTQLSYSRQLAALMRPAQEIGVTDWTALDAARVRMLAARSKRAGLQSASRRCGSLRCAVSSTGWSAGRIALQPRQRHPHAA